MNCFLKRVKMFKSFKQRLVETESSKVVYLINQSIRRSRTIKVRGFFLSVSPVTILLGVYFKAA